MTTKRSIPPGGRGAATQRRVAWLIVLGCAIVPISALAQPAPSGVVAASSFGQYSETVDDMRVKVLGGYVSVTRQWRGAEKRWVFQPNWETLGFTHNDTDVEPTKLWRGPVEYERGPLNAGAPVWRHQDPSKWITSFAGVYRWQDVKGNWVEFDAQGRATRFGDRNITVGTIVRDAEGRISGVEDHNELQVLTFEYDSQANLMRAADYSGREVLYGYVAARLHQVTDVRGNVWAYTYANGYLRTKEDPEGRIITITVDAGGVLAEIRDQDGFGAEYRYENDSRTRQLYSWMRESGDVVTELWFDRNGELVRRDFNGRTVLKMRSDGYDRIYTDETGNATRVAFDAKGRLTKLVHPDGATVVRRPGANDSTEHFINENGVRTTFENDVQGNEARIIEADGLPEQRITELVRDTDWNIIERRQVVDGGAGDRVWTYTYDPFGNVATVTDAEGNATTREHDVQGNIVRRIDARGGMSHRLLKI